MKQMVTKNGYARVSKRRAMLVWCWTQEDVYISPPIKEDDLINDWQPEFNLAYNTGVSEQESRLIFEQMSDNFQRTTNNPPMFWIKGVNSHETL